MARVDLPAYGWEPRDYQMPAWNAFEQNLKTIVLCWARRHGKDEIALHNGASKAMQRVGNYWHLLPMQEQARKALWESVNPKTGRLRWKDSFPPEIIEHVDNQSMKVTFKNNSTWQALGSDNYNCYSEDTEILTEAGWQLFSTLTGLEKVATLDNDTLVYASINQVVSYDYDGEMYRVHNNAIDLLTTPNHNFYVESSKGVRKFKRIDDPTILGDKIPATADWIGEDKPTYTLHNLTALNGQWKDDTVTFDMKDWCALVGIWLAEGSTYNAGRSNYRVIISQTKEHTCKEIDALLRRMGIRFKYDPKPGNFVISSKTLFAYFSALGNQQARCIPRDLLSLSKQYLEVLVEWMVKGDGSVNKNNTLSYFSTSWRLISDFQEAMIKLGFSGNIRKAKMQNSVIKGRPVIARHQGYYYTRRLSRYKYFRDTKESYVSTQSYKGKVWCVDAGSHVIKVRRNGYEAWCGNSLVGTTPIGMTFSEAALADPNAFGFFRPILLENNGWSVHISSPRGRNHFYRLFETYRGQPDAFVQRISANDTSVFSALQLALERKILIDLYGATLGDSLFRQEYLCEWDAAVMGAVFGQEIKLLRSEGRALPLRYDPRYPVDTSWDLGVGDTNVILFWQLVGNAHRLFDWYSSSDTGIEHYAEILASKRYFYHRHIGPHDIANREWGLNGVTRMATAKKLGLNFDRMPNVALSDSIAAGARLINNMEINVQENPVDDPMDDCAFILEALESYHFTYDKEKRVMSKNPVHDWSSHYCSALMTRGLYAAGKNATGKPMTLQGRGVEELQQFDKTRLSDILNRRDAPTNRGAWG